MFVQITTIGVIKDNVEFEWPYEASEVTIADGKVKNGTFNAENFVTDSKGKMVDSKSDHQQQKRDKSTKIVGMGLF